MNEKEFKEYLEKLEEIHKKYIEELDEKTKEIQGLDTYYVCYLMKNINKNNRRIYELRNALDEIERYIKSNIKECDGALSNPEYALISKHELLQNEKQRNKNLLEIIKKVKGK